MPLDADDGPAEKETNETGRSKSVKRKTSVYASTTGRKRGDERGRVGGGEGILQARDKYKMATMRRFAVIVSRPLAVAMRGLLSCSGLCSVMVLTFHCW